jgi:hypothetical protein
LEDKLADSPDGLLHKAEAFWRAIFADIIISESSTSRATVADFRKFQEWWIWLKEQPDQIMSQGWEIALRPPKELLPIMRTFNTTMEFRKIFVTKEGRFGTGSASIQTALSEELGIRVGTEIHIVSGSNLPLALQPVPEHTPARYKFVSTCYVHGVMDGGGVSMTKLDTIEIE